MKYEHCSQCGFQMPYNDVMDIYTVNDNDVSWNCPKCSNVQHLSLTEFIFRCQHNSKSAIRKTRLMRISNKLRP